jgi:precorrin-6x reductase
MQEYQIAHLVSKESGEAGGLQEKAQAAFKLGIPVHILSRPKLDYPRMFSAIQSLLACLKNELKIDN